MTNKSIQWWTWNPERPAAISNLVNGIVITPVLYSAKEDCATLIEPSKEIEYGKRKIDGSTIFSERNFRVQSFLGNIIRMKMLILRSSGLLRNMENGV